MMISNPIREKRVDDDVKRGATLVKGKKYERQFSLSAKIKNDDISANFLFSNLRLIVTVPILERLVDFLEKVGKVRLNYETNQKLQRQRAKIQVDPMEPEPENSEDGIIPDEIEGTANPQPSEIAHAKPKGYLESIREEREKYLMKGREMKTRKDVHKSSLIAIGTIQDLAIWIPLNSKDRFSRVLCLSFSINTSIRQASETTFILNEHTKTVLESKIDVKYVNNLKLYSPA
jgi:hypothetical protein